MKLLIRLAFIAALIVVWFASENRRFQGPPVGDQVAKRAAAIAAAEKAVGQSV